MKVCKIERGISITADIKTNSNVFYLDNKASGEHNLLRLANTRCLSCKQTQQADGSSLENVIDIPVLPKYP